MKFEPKTKIAEVKKVRFLCYCKVRWEKQVSRKVSVTQCYNCQIFGHIAKNCFWKAKCGMCAGAHNTRECIVDNKNQYKCANCDGNHMASSETCDVYTHIASSRKSKERGTDSRNGFSSNSRVSVHATERERQRTSGGANTPRPSGTWNFGNQSTKSKNSENGDFSFSSVWDEIKSFFANINLEKTMNIVRSTIDQFKKSKDVISKITCVIEGIIEIFN